MENDKKEERFQKDQPETSWLGYASSSNNFPSNLKELTKVFEKNLEALENMVKLIKSDVSKMFDISDSSFPSSSINASPEKWSSARKNCWATDCVTNKLITMQVCATEGFLTKRNYINLLSLFFPKQKWPEEEKMSSCGTGLTLKANSAGKSICYERLEDSQFRDRQA